MNDFFVDGPIAIYNGDCREILAMLGSKCERGAVICDPPYEKSMHDAKGKAARNVRTDGHAPLKPLDFDSVMLLRLELMGTFASICNGWFLAFCTPEGIAPWRDAIEAAGMSYKRACFWYKPDAAPQFNGQGPAFAVEPFVTAWNGGGVSRWNGGGRHNYFACATNGPDRQGVHPTEKPVHLMSTLIHLFTQPGDLVIDPFMGSGTTGVAAIRAGRRFLGIEINPEYYELARRRIDLATRQGMLFDQKTAPMKQKPLDWMTP